MTTKRTRTTPAIEGHDVPYHEVMTCTVCNRVYWGDCAFRAHYPCENRDYVRLAHTLYRDPTTEAVFYQEPAKPFVLLACKERYTVAAERVAKAREARSE